MNYEVICALPTETTGSPDQKLQLPSKVCDGCEKGKSKHLPFPPSTSRAKNVFSLVHSDLDEMSSASINGYTYTATYLNDHSRYGMMFFLKTKSEQFGAFKAYKAWAERHTDRQLKCIRTDRGSEFLSNEQKEFMEESRIEHQTSMPDSPQQNGRAERFQQTILNKAESMRHMAGLSSGFWSYAVRTMIHVYNVTPIAKDGFKTPKKMWSGLTPDISHLRIFGCSAYVTINKKKRRKLDLKSQEMTFIGYEPGSKGYQFWDKDSRSIVISRDVKFDESKFPYRKDLDYKNPFADKKRRSISVKNRRKTTNESDTDTEEGLVIPSTSDSDDDHRPSHPALPPPGAPPPVPPKNSPGSGSTGGKRQKTTRPDEKPSTTISTEPDTRGSVFGSMRPRYNLRPRKRHDIPEVSSSQLPPKSPPEGPSLELDTEDNKSLYATDGGSPRRSRSPSADPLNIGKLLINAMQLDTLSTYKQAMRSPLKLKWQEATRDEYNSLVEMGTWILVSLPKNRNVIKCKWVFTVKADGRHKARVVAKGFTQEHGIDYEETFSPVTRYESIRYLLAHAALEDWEIEAMDVKTAYLYGELKEEIYIAQPEGFIKSGQEHKVCKLVKSIYGLKQAGRVWYKTISKTLQKKLGFQQLHSDAAVHVLRQQEGDHEIILILYVDDLLPDINN